MDNSKNKTAKRYVEIFGEVVDKNSATLRYWGHDNKYHYLAEEDKVMQALQDVIYSMDETVFPQGYPNITGNEVFDITFTIEDCHSSNQASQVSGFYRTILIPDEGLTKVTSVAVDMNHQDITSSCTTKNADGTVTIYISNVTGDVVIYAMGK